jgi:hypothetical protein
MHLAYLMVLKQLSGKMPLLVAGMAAANAVPLILGTFMMLRYTENADEIEAMPSLVLVAYEDDAGQTKLELFTSKEKQGIPTIPPCGIEQWMRALNIQSATILNIVSLTLMLFWNIGDVKEKRSPRKSSK